MIVHVVQKWIPPRTVTGEGFWSFDLSVVFMELHEAQTYLAEFAREDSLTRIMRMELTAIEVVEEDDDRPDWCPSKATPNQKERQRELFDV